MSKPDLVKMLEKEGHIPKTLEVHLREIRLMEAQEKPQPKPNYHRPLYYPSSTLYLARLQHESR